MAACRALDESTPSPCPREGEGAGGEGLRLLDGQMGIEDVWDDGTDELVTRYGVGARGIEVVSKMENGGSETFGFPIYDTHGNMLAKFGH